MEDELDSFPFAYKVSGEQLAYKIVNTGEKFEILQGEQVIAEVAFYENWEQVSGEPLAPGLLFAICSFIDEHYK